MPYETVHEKVVQERRIRVCARCRTQLPDQVGNRGKAHMAGSMSGSLATSLGGSMLLGSVLGPVGAIGGAIVGSIAGARAGRDASDKVCDVVESQHDSLCPACRKLTDSNSKSGGGQTLGSGAPVGRGSITNNSWNGSNNNNNNNNTHDSNQLGGGQRLGSGEPVRSSNNRPGERIGEAFSWMKQSVTNVVDNVKNAADGSKKDDNNNGNGKPSQGGGSSNGPPQCSGLL